MQLASTILSDALAPLKNKNFRTYIGGQGVSLIGTFMQTAALQWFVWTLTKDSRMIGLVGALAFLPVFFLAPFTGNFSDRTDRRRLLMVVVISEMLLAFGLAALAYLSTQNVPVIVPVLLITLALGVCSAFNFPTQSAFIGDLSGMGNIRASFAFNVTMIEIGRVIGPALGGLIIARVGPSLAFLLNGLSFVAVLFSLYAVRAEQHIRPPSGNVLESLAEAVRFIRSEPRIVDLLLCSLTITLFVFSSLQLVAPIADLVLGGGPELAGTLLAMSGAGALIGSFLLAPQIQKIPRAGSALTIALLWAGAWVVFMSFATTVPVTMLGIAMFSISIPIVLGSVTSLTQLITPDTLRGRVLSFSQMISFGANPIALLLVGALGEAVGPQLAVRINGSAMLVCAVAILLLRRKFQRWVPQAHAAVAVR